MTLEPHCWTACALALGLIGALGYRVGRRRRGPALLPPDLVAELSRHKLECLAEPPARVALELALLVGGERTTRAAVAEMAGERRRQSRPTATPPARDRRVAAPAPRPAPAASGRGRDARRS